MIAEDRRQKTEDRVNSLLDFFTRLWYINETFTEGLSSLQAFQPDSL
jgi:hypothetical protein